MSDIDLPAVRLSAIGVVARALRCTEGQAYTAVIGVVLAGAMVLFGVPAAMRHRVADVVAPSARAALSAAAVDDPPAPPASTTRATIRTRAGGALAPVTPPPDAAPTAPAPESTPTVAAGTVTIFSTVGQPGAPTGVAVAPDGTVYVATGNGTGAGRAGPSAVFAYDRTGNLLRTFVISGQPDGHRDGLAGIALDKRGDLLALDLATTPPRVLQLNVATGAQATVTVIPDLQPCYVVLPGPCEPGVQDHPPAPRSIAVDRAGDLYVADAGQATIWKIDATGGAATPWYQSIDFSMGQGPSGLALSSTGDLVFTVGFTLDPAALGAAAVYRVTPDAAGRAGTRTLVATLPQNAAPADIAIGQSGSLYIALRATNSVMVLGADGSVRPTLADPLLDAPTGLAFLGSALLVSNTSPANERWLVASIAVDDRGLPLPAA